MAFRSLAGNLVPLDTNHSTDVFVHDLAWRTTERVSVSSTGEQGNHDSFDASISLDGRYVAFGSLASNLVPGDTNGYEDAFVRDRSTGITTRVSVSSTGEQGNANSFHPAISADGRYVAFHSQATNLVSPDTNGSAYDIFLHDRASGTTKLVSRSTTGVQGNAQSLYPWISADGRYVVFESLASNLVPGDTNGASDVFVRDCASDVTTRVSVSSTGAQGNSTSDSPSISADGRFVAFRTFASNLVPGDTNRTGDVLVHDRVTGTTTRVSVTSGGQQADYSSFLSSISSDGRYVAFESFATNLVPRDTNGSVDIFVHDRVRGITTRVSVSTYGEQANSDCDAPVISADGRYAGFASHATNLVPLDANSAPDDFVRRLLP